MAFLHPGTPKGVNGNTNANTVDVMKIMLGQDVRTTVSPSTLVLLRLLISIRSCYETFRIELTKQA